MIYLLLIFGVLLNGEGIAEIMDQDKPGPSGEPYAQQTCGRGWFNDRNSPPWAVAVFRTKDRTTIRRFHCSGTRVSHVFVITAAHCIYDERVNKPYWTSEISVLINNLNIVVSNVIIHDSYIAATRSNDIVLLTLPRDKLSDFNFRPICLPQYNDISISILENQHAWSHSWISIRKSGDAIEYISRTREVLIEQLEDNYTLNVKTAWSEAFCKGASGGLLSIKQNGKHFLVGIASDGERNRCAQPVKYTLVSAYLDFLLPLIGYDVCSNMKAECRPPIYGF